MTEKKKEKSQSTGKLKKLRLNKETLQDLTTKDPAHVKGGARPIATNSDGMSCRAAAGC